MIYADEMSKGDKFRAIAAITAAFWIAIVGDWFNHEYADTVTENRFDESLFEEEVYDPPVKDDWDE